jgi:hypothetical protein
MFLGFKSKAERQREIEQGALAVRVSLSPFATRGRAYRLFDLNFSP